MVRKILKGFLVLSLVVIAIGSTVGYLGSEHWYLDLFTHFKVQYSLVLVGLLIGFSVLRNKVGFAISLLLFIINIKDIVPLYIGSQPEPDEDVQVNLCSINLLTSNGSFDLVGNYIRAEQPDILVLEELSELWEIALDTILREFPYNLSIPRPDNFGIGLYSKVPLDTIRNVIVNDAQLPSILCTFSLEGETINLLATHPLPPVGQFEFESRNNAFERIATLRNSIKGDFILVGDLNTTSYSTHFKKLKRVSGLVDTRNGFGVLSTWHTDFPWLNVTLDHCLASEGLVVFDRSVGPYIGSDHLPISVKIGLSETND